MDYKHIVETNPFYSRERLRGEDDAEIRGIEWVLEQTIPTFMANLKFDCDVEKSVLGSITWEIAENVLNDLIGHIKTDRADLVISMIESGDYPDIGESAEASLADGAEA